MGGLEIRRAEERDVLGIAEIWIGQMEAPPYSLTIDEEEATAAIRGYVSSVDLTVAEYEGSIVGFCAASLYRYIDGYRVWVSELFVRKGLEGRGIGSALIGSLESRFKSHGAKKLELLASEGAGAREFYQKRGFSMSSFRKFEKTL